MRTHLVGVVLASTILFATQTSNAQEVSTGRPLQIGFLLGGETPTGAFAGGQINLLAGLAGVVLQYPLPPGRLAVRGDLTSHTFFGGDCVSILSPGYFCSKNPVRSLYSFSGDVVARLFDRRAAASPYAFGGAAMYFATSNGNTPPAGLQWGGGIEVRPGKRNIAFLEWRHMSMGSAGFSSVVFGMRF